MPSLAIRNEGDFLDEINYMRAISNFLWVSLAIAALFELSFGQGLKADEIIAKHQQSAGTQELRDSVATLMSVGVSEFQSKLPNVKGGGKAIIVSDPGNLFFVIGLNSREYPFEKIGYFAGKASLPFVTSGARSPLGAFINDHTALLSDGLFSGILSRRWIGFDSTKSKARLKPCGTKKIDDRKAYCLEYFPSSGGSSEFVVKIYFDTETFNHVRTEYRHEINPKEDPFGTLGRQGGLKLVLTERFSDFKSEAGLTLPHLYKADYLTSSNSGTYEYSWGIMVTQFYFNQKLAPDFFTFDAK